MYALKPGIRNWHWIHSMPAVWMIWELELETGPNAKRYSGYRSTTSLNSDLLASVLRCIERPGLLALSVSLLSPELLCQGGARDPGAAAAPLRRRSADPSQGRGGWIPAGGLRDSHGRIASRDGIFHGSA